jgi:hypothetical protein
MSTPRTMNCPCVVLPNTVPGRGPELVTGLSAPGQMFVTTRWLPTLAKGPQGDSQSQGEGACYLAVNKDLARIVDRRIKGLGPYIL